jgi:hypothetical protein
MNFETFDGPISIILQYIPLADIYWNNVILVSKRFYECVRKLIKIIEFDQLRSIYTTVSLSKICARDISRELIYSDSEKYVVDLMGVMFGRVLVNSQPFRKCKNNLKYSKCGSLKFWHKYTKLWVTGDSGIIDNQISYTSNIIRSSYLIHNMTYFPIYEELIKTPDCVVSTLFTSPCLVIDLINESLESIKTAIMRYIQLRSSFSKSICDALNKFLYMIFFILQSRPFYKELRFMQKLISSFPVIDGILDFIYPSSVKSYRSVTEMVKTCKKILILPFRNPRIYIRILREYSQDIDLFTTLQSYMPEDKFILNICVHIIESELMVVKKKISSRNFISPYEHRRQETIRNKYRITFLNEIIYKFIGDDDMIISIIKSLYMYQKRLKMMDGFSDYYIINFLDLLNREFCVKRRKSRKVRYVFSERVFGYIKKTKPIIINNKRSLLTAIKIISSLTASNISYSLYDKSHKIKVILDIILMKIFQIHTKFKYHYNKISNQNPFHKILYEYIFYHIFVHNWKLQSISSKTLKEDCNLCLIKYISLVKCNIDHEEEILEILYNGFMRFIFDITPDKNSPYFLNIREKFQFIGMCEYLKRENIIDKIMFQSCSRPYEDEFRKSLHNKQINNEQWRSVLLFSKYIHDEELYNHTIDILKIKIAPKYQELTDESLHQHISDMDYKLSNKPKCDDNTYNFNNFEFSLKIDEIRGFLDLCLH